MIGLFSKTIDPGVVESIGYSGMDFIILDQEHGNASNQTVENLIRASKLSGIKSIVRVPDHNPTQIGSVLDMGAYGVQVPNVTSLEQAKAIIYAAKFHPIGMRGVCRFVPAANYGTMDRDVFFADSNDTLLVMQVEGTEVLADIDEIIELEGLDVLFIGPYDLSQSLGVPGQINDPTVIEAISFIVKKARSRNVMVGTFCDTITDAKRMSSLGIEYIAYSVDLNILSSACNELKSKIE
jgi:4-hydroxy-2-oxoheptanedioate aldolase